MNTNTNTNQTAARSQNTRLLSDIAWDIQRNWQNVYFGAKPYLNAMKSLNTITDVDGYDSARSIVIYFLGNAATWRGSEAKRIKSELRSILKG